ncbi:hypothetical protein SAMN05216436_101267 [bacterium A37T11]|nr:hypothetical protein SAMN05216436_101267 [bacterium A37T11]
MIYLKAKRLTLFSLMIIAPVVILILGVLIHNTASVQIVAAYAPLAAILIMSFTYIGWLWNAGAYLSRDANGNSKLFQRLFFAILISAFLVTPVSKVMLKDHLPVIPDALNLLNFAGLLFCIYKIGKGLRDREDDKEHTRASRLADFFGIWFLPIGIWFIQPRVKKVLGIDCTNHDSNSQ